MEYQGVITPMQDKQEQRAIHIGTACDNIGDELRQEQKQVDPCPMLSNQGE